MMSVRTDGGRFGDLAGESAVERALHDASQAERVIAAGLVVGGLWLVARSPFLRRALWAVTRQAATTWLPMYMVREVVGAWQRSAPPRPLEPA